MRRFRLHLAVRRWLRIESADGAGSDRALRRVFRALPAPPLGAGFADRVMLAAGLAPRRATAPLAWRLALGGALTLAAAAAAVAPTIAFGLLRRVSPGDLLQLAASAVVETCQRLGEGLAVWQTVNSIGEIFAEVLSTPPILTALLAASLLSAGGLRLLHGLLAIDRRSDNARA
jgi:hypothetical protein